jgi:hypothetical protein
MSRSGYSDDCDLDDTFQFIRWAGAVAAATKGFRGQAMLQRLRRALDAMPVKELHRNRLVDTYGCVCTLGAVLLHDGITPPVMSEKNDDDYEDDDYNDEIVDIVAHELNIAPALAREIMYQNDDCARCYPEPPAYRWVRMRRWVESQIEKVDDL